MHVATNITPLTQYVLSHRNLKSVSFPIAEGRDDARERLITAWKRISGLWVLCVQEWDVLQSRRSHDLGHHLAALHIWGISGGQEERVYALISAHLTAHIHAALSRLCRVLRNKHTDRFYLLCGALRQTDRDPAPQSDSRARRIMGNLYIQVRTLDFIRGSSKLIVCMSINLAHSSEIRVDYKKVYFQKWTSDWPEYVHFLLFSNQTKSSDLEKSLVLPIHFNTTC